jgi:tetratricopeptide (TPR) repeat protein
VDDFAAARNFALQAAEDAGAQWAMTVDSDETLYPKPTFDLRSALVDKGLKILFANAADDSYAKERVIKIGAGVHWVGPTHEYTTGASLEEQYLTTNLKFGERPKTMAQMKHKLERDLRLLKRCVALEPRNPRWFYYLGGTCQNFGMHEEAIGHFLRCLELQGWVAEGAMAGDRIGTSYAVLKRFDEALALYRRELLKDPTKVQLLQMIETMKAKRDKAAALPSPS